MPAIRIYQSQIAPGAGVDTPRASPAAFGAGVAEAIGGVENALLQRRDMERARQREEAAVQAGVQLAEFDLVTADTANKLRDNAAADGTGHREAVLSDYDTRTAAFLDSITDKDVRGRAQVQIAQGRTRLATGEGEFEAKRRVDNMVGGVERATNLSRAALFAKPDDAALVTAIQRQDDVIDALNAPDALKDKLRGETREQLGLAFAQGLAERDPYALRQKIAGGYFTGLIDPDKLAPLHNRADTEIRGREAAQRQIEAEQRRAAADAERARREAERDLKLQVRDEIDALNDRVAAGGVVSPAELGAAVTAASRIGSPQLARRTAELGIKSLTVQGLRGQPPAAVQTYINDLSTKISKAGASASVEDLAAREAAVDYLATSKRELATDPLSFAAREGVATVVPLDAQNPGSFTARYKAAEATSRRYGGPLRLLTDEEADAWVQRINSSPQAAVESVTALRAFGQKGAYAVAQQIAPKDPAAAHMIALAYVPGAGGARNVADIQTGRELLKANPKLINPQRAATSLVNAGVPEALRGRPQLAAVIPDVASALYAARWSRAGKIDFDSGAYEGAVNAALGAFKDANGVMRGGLGDSPWGGGKTILPAGVSQDEFDAQLAALDDARLAAVKGGAPVDARGKPVPVAMLRRGSLLAIGDGRYKVEIDGRPVLRSGGGHFVLSVQARQ
jgi:hypothetical protein